MTHSSLYPKFPVLLVDDEVEWLESFSFTLEYQAGITHVLTCSQSHKVMAMLKEQPFSLVILDMTMPPPTGEQLLPLITEEYPDVPVVVLSGLNQLDTAVNCMKLGATDYYTKTTEISHLMTGLKRILTEQDLRRELQTLKSGLLSHGLNHPDVFDEIVTRSPMMIAVFKYLEAVAGSCEPVLIIGESGAGKELIAKAVHRLSCPDAPWVAVNVAGLDDTAFSDTLFGHVRGAFTGADRPREGMIAKASGGVLFLDEIGDLSLQSQVKLLRLLQEKEYFALGSDAPRQVEARIICATNCDLAGKQQSGAFRKDLYYRLCSHQVVLPPLRERSEDLPLLLNYFLQQAADQLNKEVPTYPPQLPVLLSTYHFPGNIRELRGMIYDALSQHRQGILSMDVFRQAIAVDESETSPALCPSSGKVIFPEQLPTLDEVAGQLVEEAMKRSQDNQSIASRLLGISQPALSRRLKKSSQSPS
ncbi:sigma-54 dependent transcriptional regulator [uncultured Desulfuromonas sp.]|uniref:sigma-54-dependent transcriptional regulator n=1 Tax=uncultured Desulfuromonas sp. TaxID=181013 RepID=UPI002AAB6724|nr:sigma-54 dependent transcriptional regulator [uncultured Desulfuromonas sp.]